MSEDLVNIEINGVPVQARKGAMLIEVTDAQGIEVPRFCYHRKLSVAANCRMCLVEVERAPKPLPACATPVTDGMKVFTRSPAALAAQKATMEFLLINHPLDCPVCDQGGECELQDVAMGYGEGVSRYTEAKRAVRDKDIGPLIATEMTRCIHCTRCVRFGDEIACLPELGATGRGEFMEIGTFVEKAIASELSGNVIDLCPVGALTARPSRMQARAWDLIQHAGIAAHDALGSNIHVHTLRGRVVRVVPRDNEAINETWISDRDRFSYEGIHSDDRLLRPLLRRDDAWEEVDWETALEVVASGLKKAAPASVGALASPGATTEELYLLQKLMRALGSANIDHRLRQTDFGDQDRAPLFPWLGQDIGDLESLDAALLVGSDLRSEQPLLAHRLRKAVRGGAQLMVVNPRAFDFLCPLAAERIVAPQDLVRTLAGVLAAVLATEGAGAPGPLSGLLRDVEPGDRDRRMAEELLQADRATVLLGAVSMSHPDLSALRALAAEIAARTGARLGYVAEGANGAGAWLAGCVPHRGAGGEAGEPGLDAARMLAEPLEAYLLLGVEPEFDCDDPAAALRVLEAAGLVVMISPYAGEAARRYADVILPVTTFAETSGTFVNAEGRWQSFHGAARTPGESRPAWKVLRVLGNLLDLEGFDQLSSEQVLEELKSCIPAGLEFSNRLDLDSGVAPPRLDGALVRGASTPIYAGDATVRRAGSLQRTPAAARAAVAIHPRQAGRLGLEGEEWVVVTQGEGSARLPLELDEGVPEGCAWIPVAVSGTESLGTAFGAVSLEKG